MGKSAEQLKLWRERAAEEAADSMLPKTVPPFTSTRIWELTGNSIAQAMAALGAGELHARWKSAKELLSTGVVTLGTDLPAREDDLYDDVALKWRARTKAAEIMSTRVPDRHDIDDSFLNVALRRLDKVEEDDLNERDEALGYLASFTAARSAEEGAWCDGGLGAGSCDGALGAVRLSADSRSEGTGAAPDAAVDAWRRSSVAGAHVSRRRRLRRGRRVGRGKHQRSGGGSA